MIERVRTVKRDAAARDSEVDTSLENGSLAGVTIDADPGGRCVRARAARGLLGGRNGESTSHRLEGTGLRFLAMNYVVHGLPRKERMTYRARNQHATRPVAAGLSMSNVTRDKVIEGRARDFGMRQVRACSTTSYTSSTWLCKKEG